MSHWALQAHVSSSLAQALKETRTTSIRLGHKHCKYWHSRVSSAVKTNIFHWLILSAALGVFLIAPSLLCFCCHYSHLSFPISLSLPLSLKNSFCTWDLAGIPPVSRAGRPIALCSVPGQTQPKVTVCRTLLWRWGTPAHEERHTQRHTHSVVPTLCHQKCLWTVLSMTKPRGVCEIEQFGIRDKALGLLLQRCRDTGRARLTLSPVFGSPYFEPCSLSPYLDKVSVGYDNQFMQYWFAIEPDCCQTAPSRWPQGIINLSATLIDKDLRNKDRQCVLR